MRFRRLCHSSTSVFLSFCIFLTDSIATRVAIRDSVPLSQCDGVCRILSVLVLFFASASYTVASEIAKSAYV